MCPIHPTRHPATRAAPAALVLLALTSCAGHIAPAGEPVADGALAACRDLVSDLDRQIADAGVGDAQSARVAGFPYLRVSRLLASPDLKPAADSPAFDAWVSRLRELDTEARGVELANLARHVVDDDAEIPDAARVEACADRLASADLSDPVPRGQLLEVARVSDAYSATARVIGLYPLTSVPFKMGVGELHERLRADFAMPLAELPVHGILTRYLPPPASRHSSSVDVGELMQVVRRDRLGIPRPSEDQLALLLERFAPIIEVDEVSGDDRIGTPVWLDTDAPSVAADKPTVYTHVSHARFGGEILLQLNYVVWFPARTSTGALDLLAGRLDGLTFRVTLAGDGRPLIHDSMHNCGCYHVFLPGPRLEQRPRPESYEEPPLVVHAEQDTDARAIWRLSHGSHYVQRLSFGERDVTGVVYALRDADRLRSLPAAGGGRRSLYAPDGLVSGTERGERWLFWPMGVPSPGAMRQWGHHAIAFVGMRHFDDPDLIERYFSLAPEIGTGEAQTR